MKTFMVAYISPNFGLLMSQMECDEIPSWEEVARHLHINEGESEQALEDIRQGCKWEVKEVRQNLA